MQDYKNNIARAFSRTAGNYDNVAILQQAVREHLLTLLPLFTPSAILDLGSGTGILSAKLACLFPNARVLGVDIAHNMIEFSKVKWQTINNLEFICADADYLPYAQATMDLVISNLMLQWSVDMKLTLGKLHQIIKPGGQLLFSTLGANSLCELKAAWSKVDNYMHVNNFFNSSDINAYLHQLKFKHIHIKVVNYCYAFNSVYELMRQLKLLGANSLQSRRKNGLYGKTTFTLLQKYYQEVIASKIYKIQSDANSATHTTIPATYEVYYVSATK